MRAPLFTCASVIAVSSVALALAGCGAKPKQVGEYPAENSGENKSGGEETPKWEGAAPPPPPLSQEEKAEKAKPKAGGNVNEAATRRNDQYDKEATEVVIKRAARQVKENCGHAKDDTGKATGPWGKATLQNPARRGRPVEGRHRPRALSGQAGRELRREGVLEPHVPAVGRRRHGGLLGSGDRGPGGAPEEVAGSLALHREGPRVQRESVSVRDRSIPLRVHDSTLSAHGVQMYAQHARFALLPRRSPPPARGARVARFVHGRCHRMQLGRDGR